MHIYTLSDSYTSLERRHHMSSKKVEIHYHYILLEEAMYRGVHTCHTGSGTDWILEWLCNQKDDQPHCILTKYTDKYNNCYSESSMYVSPFIMCSFSEQTAYTTSQCATNDLCLLHSLVPFSIENSIGIYWTLQFIVVHKLTTRIPHVHLLSPFLPLPIPSPPTTRRCGGYLWFMNIVPGNHQQPHCTPWTTCPTWTVYIQTHTFTDTEAMHTH